jgi:hypothetical protein
MHAVDLELLPAEKATDLARGARPPSGAPGRPGRGPRPARGLAAFVLVETAARLAAEVSCLLHPE